MSAPDPVPSASIPRAALLLGAGGLIPFVALSGLAIATGLDVYRPAPAVLLAFYGAAILSFLGGARWGLSLDAAPRRRAAELTLAVTPSLLAFLVLGLLTLGGLPLGLSLAVLALAHVLMGALDWFFPAPGSPPWYRRLRVGLTTGAALSLLAGAWAEGS